MPDPRPLRVAHVTEQWVGGIATYVSNLLAHQMQSPDYSDVHLIYDPRKTPEEEIGPEVKRHPYRSGRRPGALGRAVLSVRRIVADIEPDVVHLHSTFPGLYGRLLRLAGKPPPAIVYCPHGWAFAREAPDIQKRLIAGVERMLAGRSAAHIHISEHERQLAQAFRVRAPIERVVPHGVRDVAQRPEGERRRHPGGLVVGFIGRLDRQKGFDRLVEALSLCRRDDIVVLVAGKPELGDQSGFGLLESERFRFLNWVPNGEIDDLIAECDTVVIPSRWEGFGLVALEAMRNGRAPIVSDRGALPEIIRDGVDGYVFPFDGPERLAELLDSLDTAKLGTMGAEARRRFGERFRLDVSMKAVDVIYRETLAAQPAPQVPAAAEGWA